MSFSSVIRERAVNRPCSIILIFAILVISSVVPFSSGQAPTGAATILMLMTQRYRHLVTYQDEGVVVTTSNESSGVHIDKLPFKTFFRRPAFFRFEWIDDATSKLPQTNVVWCNGKEAFTYWATDRYEREVGLGLAIAKATGISKGSAHTVARLLLEEGVGGFGVDELANPSLIGEEVFEGSLCYHIQGFHPGGALYELWIGKADMLLRKVQEERKAPGGSITEQEIRRNIRVDEPIANDVFDYKPPIALTPRKDSTSSANPEGFIGGNAPVWSEFKSEEGRFRLLMPETPSSQTVTMETSQGRFKHHIFIATHGAFICLIEYADMPMLLGDARNENTLYDAARNDFLKQTHGRLADETKITSNGSSGRELRIVTDVGQMHVRLFLIDGRFYQLCITQIEVHGKRDEKSIKKFLDSFQVVRTPRSVALQKDLTGVLHAHSTL